VQTSREAQQSVKTTEIEVLERGEEHKGILLLLCEAVHLLASNKD
jgi:hypothetical protein